MHTVVLLAFCKLTTSDDLENELRKDFTSADEMTNPVCVAHAFNIRDVYWNSGRSLHYVRSEKIKGYCLKNRSDRKE